MGLDAFNPCGLTKLVAATTTASTAITLDKPTMAVRVQPSDPVYFAFGSSVGSSAMVAAAPSTSTPGNGIPLLGGSAEVFNIGPNAYLSFVTSGSTGASVFLTPGMGS
jgi:hypothetical protein